jgi:very-short-patch-repair endonuclease
MRQISIEPILRRLEFENDWRLRREFEIQWSGFRCRLDGYDDQRRIVVEVDEPFHNGPKYQAKDSARMAQVIRLLSPSEVYRYSLEHNRLQCVYRGFVILDWSV